MVKMTRRDTLKLSSIGALGALMNACARGSAEEKDASKAKSEILLLGPFSLGKLYERRPDKRSLGNEVTDGKGPAESKIVEAFDHCQLYVIDKKHLTKSGEWRFMDNGYPKILAQGDMHFELKDDNNIDFKLYFAELVGGAEHTNYDDDPPSRHLIVGAQFEILMGNKIAEADLARYGVDFGTNCIAYDINGKVLSAK